MKPAHIAVLVVRLVAFYIAVLAALGLADLGFLAIDLKNDELRASWLLGAGITIVLQCALAWIVFASAPRIAGEIAREPSSEPIGDRLAAGQLALRVAAIMIFYQAFHFVPRIVHEQRATGLEARDSSVMYLTAMLVTFAGLGVLLYWKSAPLARRLFGTVPEHNAGASALAQAVAFSVLGVWFVIGVLPELAQRTLARVLSSENAYQLGLDYPDDTLGLVAAALRFVLGLWLFLSAAGLALAWHKLRTAGLMRANEPERTRAVESKP